MANQILHESKYSRFSYEESTQILYCDWFATTEYMTKEDFKEEMEIWLKVSEQVQPKYLLDDCANFLYPISPDEQIWMTHLLNPAWIEMGLERYAHLTPDEFVANLSFEQLFEEFFDMNLPNQFEIEHFSDHEKAKKWLLDKKQVQIE